MASPTSGSFPIGPLMAPASAAALPAPAAAVAMISLWRILTNERNVSVIPDSEVYGYFDTAAERLNRKVGYHITTDTSTIVLVAGQQEYDIPADCVEVVWLEHVGKILQKGDTEKWRADNADWRTEPVNMPREWAIYGSKIVLRPAPSLAAVAAAVSPVLRYVSTPRSVQVFGPEQLASQDRNLIVYGAVGIYSASYPDSNQAMERVSFHEGLFDKESDKVVAYYAERRLAR